MLRLTSCVVDLDRREVRRTGAIPQRSPLTCREAGLLQYLAARPGQVVPRDEALREVFGYSAQVVSRAVDGVVRRLRVKIEADPDRPVHLITEFGVGYRLEIEPAREPVAPLAPRRPLLRLSGVEVDLAAGQVHRPDGVVSLVGYELTLLRELVRSAGPTLDPNQLERRVWGSVLGRSNRLRSLVWRLRTKIERHPGAPEHLLSVRGHGYRFVFARSEAEETEQATVLAASVAPDPTGDRTEQLWCAIGDVAAKCGGYATNLAAEQACIVFLGEGDPTRAAELLSRAVRGAAVALATGDVRRVLPPGSSRPEYVGQAIARAVRAASRRGELGDRPSMGLPERRTARG